MSEKEKEYKIGKYLIKRTLGRGTFGKVKLGIYLPTKEKVAIKILEKSKIREKDDEIRVQREFEMLTKFNHINLILVAEIFESYDAFYTVMEYCEGGELFNYIVKKRKLSEEESSFFYYQIIKGLEYIHSLNIVHRDLKPENLLLTRNHILKIIDFGLSNYFNNNQNNLLVTPCGSPCYASPEMVSGKKYNGFKIDIWSTGIILYAMLCGYLPFEDKDNDLLFKKILECKLDLPHHLSLLSKDLIKKILVTNPDKRISIKEIKKHPFFLKGKTLYKQEFSFSNIPFELIVDYDDSDNDFSYKNNKTETEGKNDYVLKSRDFNATVPNDNSQINKGNILFEEKKNNLEEDKIKDNEIKKKEEKEKDEKEEKEKEEKEKEKEKKEEKKKEELLKMENEKEEKLKKKEKSLSIEKKENNKEEYNKNDKIPNKRKIENKENQNLKTKEDTYHSLESKQYKSHQTSTNYYNNKTKSEEIEESEKIIKTEPNIINAVQKLKEERKKTKNKNSNQKKVKSKKKPMNSTTITHTSYNLSNIINYESNLNSMRIPINTLIRKHNLITKRKSNITIKNTVINVNMFPQNSILTSFTKKNNNSRPNSISHNNNNTLYNKIKSERKKPELKFYDFDSPFSTNYNETIVKTQENFPIKSFRNDNYKSNNINNKNSKIGEGKVKKHNKINSLKLSDFYKNHTKKNKKNINSFNYKSLNSTTRNSKKINSSSLGKKQINVKGILPKKKSFNMKDLLIKDLLKKFK